MHRSIFTIFCSLRDSHDFEWLQHCDRHGYVEHSGESFRPSVDRRELAGTGSLSLPRRNRTASSRISSGREGYRTPVGRFQVIRKDEDHRSSVYGDYVDNSGHVVKANVDSRRDSNPPHSHFVGAPMPYFIEFSPGYGLHQGYLPGEPASHGCIRMPYWKARQFYNAAHLGTVLVIKP